MPEFYAAIFGTGEEGAAEPPPTVAREGAGVVGATASSDVGVAGGVGDSSSEGDLGGRLLSEGRAERAEEAAPAASLEQLQQQQQNAAGGGGVRSEEVTGVALQERLVRLRETFAKEQCAAVLRQATGW